MVPLHTEEVKEIKKSGKEPVTISYAWNSVEKIVDNQMSWLTYVFVSGYGLENQYVKISPAKINKLYFFKPTIKQTTVV